jgi:hypothetical protein
VGTAGRKLWRSIVKDYDLEEHELLLLREAARTVDALDRLTAEIADGRLTTYNSKGDLIPHPALVEARQQRIVLTRLFASMRLPSGDDEARPQRRGAARGAYGYGIRGAV